MQYFTRHGSLVAEDHILSVSKDGQSAGYKYLHSCSRCGGLGGGSQWNHTGWTCFDCGGRGKWFKHDGKAYSAEKNAKLDEAQAKRDAAKLAKHNAKVAARQAAAAVLQAEFKVGNEDVVAAIETKANSFYESLYRQYQDRGQLTEAQVVAVRQSIEKEKDKVFKAAISSFVGEEKQRLIARVTVERVSSFVGYDWCGRSVVKYNTKFRTAEGNALVYWGHVGDEGEQFDLKFTVKEHAEYQGEKQTTINRPVIVSKAEEAQAA